MCGGYDGRACKYHYKYNDESFPSSDVVVETDWNTPGGTITLVRIAFGCGYDNGGIFNNVGLGIIGLGGSGFISLISQIEGSIGGQFSYCIVSEFRKGTCKINFGKDCVVSSPGAVSTPIVSIGPDLYYVVNLEGFIVGKTRFSYGDNSADSEAKESIKVVKMLIDSGMSLMLMSSQFFDYAESAITEAICLPRVPDPHSELDLCYKSPGGEIDVLVVTLHFTSGADMALNTVSTFVQFVEDLVSVTIKPTNNLSILKKFVHMGFKVGFNLRKRIELFMATDCTVQ